MKNLQVLDAVETLSKLSQVSDSSHPELLPQPERIKKAFETLSTYLTDLYKSDQMLLKNHDYLASLKAVMIIAEEAYDKLDLVSKIFNTNKHDLGDYAFNHLYDFYLKKINYKVEHIAGDVFRHVEEEKQRAITDTHGLKNLEVIRRDSEYELFIIKDEEGLNHFSKNLLRHTQLLGTFDELFLSFQGEDPFVKLKFIEDRIKQKRALSVREEMAPRIDYFVKEAFRFKKQPFIGLSCSVMTSLFLASYPSLVLQNDPTKACFEYFDDTLMFLTQLVTRTEFFKEGSAVELISDKGIIASQRFIAGVIRSLFLSKNDIRYVAEHLYQYVPRPKVETFSPISFFDQILSFDSMLRGLLSHFPSGPLMKALDFIKDQNRPVTFAPIRVNLPQSIMSLSYQDKACSVISMGSPTMQQDVKLAQIDPLFDVFLHQLEGQRTIILNLEDPQNPYCQARIRALCSIEKDYVVHSVIPRAGIFYQQLETYAFIDDASEFKKLFFDQFEFGENLAYSLSSLTIADVEPLFHFVHDRIFDSKSTMHLKDRLVFVELMQMFMGLSLIQKFEAENLIIICKDGLDHSNAYTLSIHALVSLLNHENLLTKETLDLYISELYGPVMTIRDRAIFEESIVRMASALSYLHAKIVKDPTLGNNLRKYFPLLGQLKVKKD
jgi:hypothetical protein